MTSCDSHSPTLETDKTEVTVLVTYTEEARVAADDIQGEIMQGLADTNAAFENSAIPLRFVPVHVAEVTYEMTDRFEDLKRLVRTSDGHLDEIHVLRDQYEADLVVFVPDKRDATINASVMAEASTAFVIVHWEFLDAPDYGLAHELGHLFGARHTLDSDPSTEPFAFGHGFRNDSLRTIMANGPQQRVPYFSGPEQRFEGVALGDSTLHNAAEVLRRTAIYIANFRGPQQATDFVPSATFPVVNFAD
ncbi:MAG TPA: M12 family metallo-peptidase [Rhodothermales bacterium]|nr:M12 family metallo-peptidase [Rhodothermales bacterium]